ncbi:hypothetical protein Nos7107_4502 [Nostoc sp. PCC 7107]|nr:hypothetical protein Nos7107_4502 [Nostoc sp. PCC 7107]
MSPKRILVFSCWLLIQPNQLQLLVLCWLGVDIRTYATPIMSLRLERSVGKQSQRQGRLLPYRTLREG